MAIPQAVIFDLYGVLALNGWQAFKLKHAGQADAWAPVIKLGRRVDAGDAKYAELVRFTAEQTGESEETVRYQLEHNDLNDELLQYITTTLKPHFKLGILSNASTDVVSHLFSEEQRALFDAIILSHHVGLTKPDPEMFRLVTDALGLESSECLYVDDQQRHIDGAAAVGMQTLLYTDLAQLQTDLNKVIA